MTSPVRIDTNLATILYFTFKKLVADGVCTTTTGIIGQNPDDNFVPPSTSYYVISGRRQNLVSAETKTWAGVVTVRGYTFSAVDIAMRDRINAVYAAGQGVQAIISGVINSLDLWDMNNGSFYYLAQPMRLSTQNDFVRNQVRSPQGEGWSYCEVVFDVLYGENPNFVQPEANDINEFTTEFSGSFV
jgi:hypothetical protein